MTWEEYKALLPTIPAQPGVYQFLTHDGQILYVGKAKNLKKRIASYFVNSEKQGAKTKALIRNASRLVFTIVESEHEALLLENSLIKAHQPRYNVMLKDGKSYAYICVRNENFPRVYFTRKLVRDGSTYFGPYTSKFKAEVVLELIKTLFPLRTCALNLSDAAIERGKYKVCLEYHIKNCMGPCEKHESAEQYNEKIQQVKNILRGHFKLVKNHIKQQMLACAERLDFEKAQEWKLKMQAVDDYHGRSTVVSTSIRDVDVFSIAANESEVYINFLKVIDGAIIHAYTMKAVKNLDQDLSQILSLAIPAIREKFNSLAPEIIVPMRVPLEDSTIRCIVPKAGEKKKLLELSEKNAEHYLMQKRGEKIQSAGQDTPAERILKTLQVDLNLPEFPLHIECFDNSNLQGTSPVAACVVFKHGKPFKQDYRHFHVKSVAGPDDFATMQEIVYRRYKRMLEEGKSLPQLIIIDGGKGQLSAAMAALQSLGLDKKLAAIGIAKKLEEIYFPNDSVPLHINKKSESLKLIQRIRNEAHRFGINFHRDTRSKKFIQSELLSIEGIGAHSATKLLSTFGSVKRIREASVATLASVVGTSKAQKIKNFFKL